MDKSINLDTINNLKLDRAISNLAANLIMDKRCNEHVTFALCGCNPMVGTSTLADQLAEGLAIMGYKTLLMNCNMLDGLDRHAPDQPGISEFVLDHHELPLYSTQDDDLKYIPCGEVNAGRSLEILCHARMATLFEAVKKVFDFVIVDTPDFKSATDSMLISSLCDTSILVAASDETSFYDMDKLKTSYEKNSIRILGVVLNKMNER